MTSSSRFRELLSRLRSALFYWPLTVLITLLVEPVSIGTALLDRTRPDIASCRGILVGFAAAPLRHAGRRGRSGTP